MLEEPKRQPNSPDTASYSYKSLGRTCSLGNGVAKAFCFIQLSRDDDLLAIYFVHPKPPLPSLVEASGLRPSRIELGRAKRT